MAKRTEPRKGLIPSIFDRLGDFIITSIRLWKILRSRRSRRIFFHQRKEKQRATALLKKRQDWKARRPKKTKEFFRIHVLARLQRRRLTGFHRHTEPRQLIKIYLVPAAVLSLGLTIFLLIRQTQIHIQRLPQPVLSDKEQVTKLLGQTARLLADNRADDVQKNIEALNALVPGNITVLTHTGAMHLLRKDYAAARVVYNQVLALNPSNYIAHYNLAEIEFVTKNYPEAERRFGKIHAVNPRDETVLFRLYLCALLQNDPDADRYAGKLSTAGLTPALKYATAARLIRQNQNAEARKLLDQARTLFSGQTAFYDATFRQIGFIK